MMMLQPKIGARRFIYFSFMLSLGSEWIASTGLSRRKDEQWKQFR